MKSLHRPHFEQARRVKQRGVVLFLTLISLLAMSLAAVALIRSVDTNSLIAGNMAFKQSASTSTDAGLESSIVWIMSTQSANASKSVFSDTTHAFNVTDATRGYYSNADSSLDLLSSATWDAITNIPEVTDSSGNKVRYIIQRICRNANAVLSTTNCLFSSAVADNNGNNVPLPSEICDGAGCPSGGQSPQYRITARATSQRFAVSYVQAFVY